MPFLHDKTPYVVIILHRGPFCLFPVFTGAVRPLHLPQLRNEVYRQPGVNDCFKV